MEDDDEFGDLYTDVLLPVPAHPQRSVFTAPVSPPGPALAPAASLLKPAAISPNSLFRSDNDDDNDDEGTIFRQDASSGRPLVPATSSRPSSLNMHSAPQEREDEDWVLGQVPISEEHPEDWNDEEDRALVMVSSSHEAVLPREQKEFRVSFEEVEDEEDVLTTVVLEGRQEVAERNELEIAVPEGVESAAARKTIEAMKTGDGFGDLDQEPVIPGLSAASAAPGAFHGFSGGDDKDSRSDDIDSDSEDDLQIVLNDDNLGHFGGNRNRAVVEDEDDEDGEEDLVIVTDEGQNHHHPVMEEQEWGDELMQQGLDGENNEALDSKANGGVGVRIGYGSHGFHGQHHSQYKYIRPGATVTPGGAAVSSGPPPGQARSLPMGPMIGRPRGMQKGFHSGYGSSAWTGNASGRAYGGGLEFTLPSHKTIFDVDVDGFEEKPWKISGIDISDFFNFGLDEDGWKDYRKQLDLLRLEATMQSKIRVYESGRSEQDYDPDLPPELAAATGVQDVFAGNSQVGKTDGTQVDLIGQGRGAIRSQQQLPTGRAIQVESGYGERLPSIDTRPPRIRDSDAIIEIVLQESFDNFSTSNAPSEQPYECGKEEFRGCNEVGDKATLDPEHLGSSPYFVGRKREVQKGYSTGSTDGRVMEGNGTFPSPDVSMQYHSTSKPHSPIYTGDHHSASLGIRSTEEPSCERYSHVNDQRKHNAISRQSDKLQVDDAQKEKSEGSAVVEISQTLSTAPLDADDEVILEEKSSDEKDHPILDGVSKIENKEITFNLPLPDETLGDGDSQHAFKKQKLTSRVEQPAFQGDGIDSKMTHDDTSRLKSTNSKDHSKRHEGGEEEVMQHSQVKQSVDVEKHHDEGKQSSSQQKDNHKRDGRHDIESGRSASKGREDITHFQQDQGMRPATHHERRVEGVERLKERDGFVGGRQRRDDDSYARRAKDEDAKRDQDKDIDMRHKNKVLGEEKKGKDDDPHSRRHVDDGDWKVHHYRDGTSRQREREDASTTRRESLDDFHVKRKKEEEQRRREKVTKEDSQHGYRGKEDGSHGKRERDDGTDQRRREDQTRMRDKPENHHSVRHRDESWRQREREDRLRIKQHREDSQKHKERDGRTAARAGRVLEEKTIGGNSGRPIDTYPAKDRRRHGDHHRKVDRGEEHTRPDHEMHEGMHTRDYQLNKKEKNSRHERLISHNDHSLTASDCERIHREHLRKGKEIEVRESSLATGKRKVDDNNSNFIEKGGMNGKNDHEGNNRSYYVHSQKSRQLNDEPPDIQGQHNHSSTNHEEEHAASDDDNHTRRGRSKLERWTSHKERDYSNSSIHSLSSSSRVGEQEVHTDDASQRDELIKFEDNNIQHSDANGMEVTQISDMTGKESDRHLDTVAKLKKRSERFKLPMPGDKEAGMVRKTESESSLLKGESETVADADIKHERPARKRRWSSS